MTAPQMRIGNGFDVHALVAGRRLVLGGVTIPHERGLAGHSDADVLVHAICDAILGALGVGDIGVGMTVESALMGNSHASQHEAAACDERVYIEPVADARLRRRHFFVRRCSRIASARATSSG